jgi:hypothetical protein
MKIEVAGQRHTNMYRSVSQKLVLFYLGQLTSRVFGAAGRRKASTHKIKIRANIRKFLGV